jgi:hypothetical protein
MPRLLSIGFALLVSAMSLGAAERVMAPPERALSAFSEDPARQFDFWIGDWDVNLRMLQDDLTFEDSVSARARIYGILGGKAILELWDSQPIKGYSLRYYDPAAEDWALWLAWPGQNRSGVSGLRGGFRHGRGEFASSYVKPDGERITQRYSFNDITPFSLRWDDRYSNDGGKSWIDSWVMEWSRRKVDPDWPVDPDDVPTFEDGGRCDEEAFRPYEAIVGRWESAEASLEAYRILDGCAVMGFLATGDRNEFLFLTYSGPAVGWETDVLDDDPATGLRRFFSMDGWETLAAEEETLEWSVEGDRLVYRRGGRELVMSRAR